MKRALTSASCLPLLLAALCASAAVQAQTSPVAPAALAAAPVVPPQAAAASKVHEFTLSNGDTMKLWKLNGAYDDLSALPMKGMVEEFPIEAEENTVYVADVTANGETTRQYLRADKAGRNGTASVKTFELESAE